VPPQRLGEPRGFSEGGAPQFLAAHREHRPGQQTDRFDDPPLVPAAETGQSDVDAAWRQRITDADDQ
jgi:hypothetical protein